MVAPPPTADGRGRGRRGRGAERSEGEPGLVVLFVDMIKYIVSVSVGGGVEEQPESKLAPASSVEWTSLERAISQYSRLLPFFFHPRASSDALGSVKVPRHTSQR